MLPLWAYPGLVLTSLLPGWLLLRAVWPHERVRDPFSFLRALVLAVGLSIAVTIVVGSILGFLPHGETGLFTPAGIAVGLLVASGALFAWGVRRGAFPRLSRRAASQPERADAEAPFAVARR